MNGTPMDKSQRDQVTGRILDLIHESDSFLITSQLDPDGDSVGSQLALRRLIVGERGESFASKVAIVNQVACPKRYHFLADAQTIVTPEEVGGRAFDAGFVLDGGVDRTGSARPLYDGCKKKVIVDHHKTTTATGYDIPFIDPAMSSTAEMIFSILEHPSAKTKLDAKFAAQIYLGMIYDTGSFQYALTTARTHRIAAALLDTGIAHADIAERVMLESPMSAKVLLGRTLAAMRVIDGGRIAWTTVSRALAKETNATDEDVRAIITQMIFIEGVRVALLFYEREPGKVKLSLRSREGFDVASFARQLDPGGGGHARAAGCSLPLVGSLDDVASRVVSQLEGKLAAA